MLVSIYWERPGAKYKFILGLRLIMVSNEGASSWIASPASFFGDLLPSFFWPSFCLSLSFGLSFKYLLMVTLVDYLFLARSLS